MPIYCKPGNLQLLKNIAFSVYKKPSLYLFAVLIVFTIDRQNRWFDANQGNFPLVSDVDQYYSYLPAAFIHHDLAFTFPNTYWTTHLSNGTNIPKVTMGMAVMYSPFFLIGRSLAANEKNDPYADPYKKAIHFGSLLYALLGLWFLRKSLLHFFTEGITCITLICLLFGSNLFYYTYGHGEMPHVYLFFLFSLFVFFVLKWHQSKKAKHLFLFSFIAGFATLIRPTECIILLFPLLLDVKSLADLKQRMQLFFAYRAKLLFASLLFLFPFFLQMLYWKVYANQWFFFSYGEERFFFNDPQIINFLLSYRKGWLIYTPLMAFALIGIPLLKKSAPGLLLFTSVYTVFTIYLLSCWWDWAFGGSFGCRALVQHYVFFAFSFAAFVSFSMKAFKKNKVLRYSTIGIISILFCFLIALNLRQSWLYKYGIIHYSGMTKEAYWYIISKRRISPEEFKELDKKMRTPTRETMLKGNRDD